MLRYLLDVFIPTLNEEQRLDACIDSIRRQRVPDNVDISIAIIDAGSTDSTVKIAEGRSIAILDNRTLKDPEAAKMLGLEAATGDFILFMDADMMCADESTLANLLAPLMDDENLDAAYGRYVPMKGDLPINRALSMNPMQCDPVYQAFVPAYPKYRSITIFGHDGLAVPPIAGTTMYRLKPLRDAVPFEERYFDVDVPIHMARNEHGRFACIPEAHFFHGHIRSFRELVRKRLRNLDNGGGNGLLTKQRVPRVYKWIALQRFGVTRTILRAMLAASGIGLFPQALNMWRTYRDPAALLWPLLGPLVAGTLAVGMLRSGSGRAYLAQYFRVRSPLS